MNESAVFAYVRALEERIAALERLEGIQVGTLFNDAKGDPAPVGSTSDGAAIEAARRDHSHAIAAGAVDSAALGSAAVTTAKLAAGAVDSAALGSAAVTTAKLAAGAVDSAALGSAAVTTAKLAAGAVDSAALGSAAVTTAKLAAGAVTSTILADGACLAEILDNDGSGSGLDADLLDGVHESSLLRANGSRALTADWDIGAGRHIKTDEIRARSASGLSLEDSTGALGVIVEAGGNVGVKTADPVEALHVTGNVQASGGVRVAQAIGAGDAFVTLGASRTASGYAYLTLTGDTTNAYGVRLIRWNDGANADSLLSHRGTGSLVCQTESDAPFKVNTTSAERLRVRNAGLGISGPGTTKFDPQGPLHVHDGNGGWLFATKTAIGTTAQTIIPDAAGDVTALAAIDALVSNGTLRSYANFSLEQGGVTTQDIAIGTSTYQFRLNANGSLDVRRTAGTAAGSVVLQVLWY